MKNSRRDAIKKLIMAPALLTFPALLSATSKGETECILQRLQFSVNAYSFNDEFKSGEMDLFDMMELASDIGLNAVNLSAYYFSSYPKLPEKSEILL